MWQPGRLLPAPTGMTVLSGTAKSKSQLMAIDLVPCGKKGCQLWLVKHLAGLAYRLVLGPRGPSTSCTSAP
jgi:hypothetical protein